MKPLPGCGEMRELGLLTIESLMVPKILGLDLKNWKFFNTERLESANGNACLRGKLTGVPHG